MQESFYKYMKVGIIHFMAYPNTIKGEGNIVETITKIAEDDFFTAIEITWIKDPEVRKQAKAILDTSGMAVGYGAQPAVLITPLNPNSLDEDERKAAVKALMERLDEAHYMGAERMAFLSGKAPAAKDREAAIDALIKSTRELCDYAMTKDMAIAIETFDEEIDKKALIGSSIASADFASTVNRSNFGLMVDLSHLPLLGETPYECAEAVQDHVVHLHVGNCVMANKDHPAYGDKHPRFGVEGGENDVEELAEYLCAFMDVDFLNGEDQPFMSFEVSPMKDKDGNIIESSEVVIANAKRTLREAWAMI
ncbi:TIM barrel protein [Candidatus Poribacteria bacterium]|nr:TIM barrel protein [Candidatus Poribacteria bacterium]